MFSTFSLTRRGLMSKCRNKPKAGNKPTKKNVWYTKLLKWLKKKPVNVTIFGGSSLWAGVVLVLIFIFVPFDPVKLQAFIDILKSLFT